MGKLLENVFFCLTFEEMAEKKKFLDFSLFFFFCYLGSKLKKKPYLKSYYKKGMGNPGVWEGEKPGWLGRDGKRMDYERTMRNQRETSYPGSKSDDANGRDRTALLTPRHAI